MTTIELWTGTTIPRLGLGCWAIGGPMRTGDQPLGWGAVDDATSIAAIRRGVDLGIRYFDTADAYGAGHSEELLAQALDGTSEDIFISTKLGNTFNPATRELTGISDSPDYVRTAVEGSLRRLGRERLDLVFFHVNHHPVDRTAPVFAVLDELRQAGKVAAYGWSNDDVEGVAAFAGMDGFTAVQHDMNLFRPADEMSQFVVNKGLVAMARQPLAMGLLTGKFRMGERGFAANDIRAAGPEWLSYFIDGVPNPDLLRKVEAARDLLTSDGRTVAQGALAWIWARSPRVVPIPGFKTVAQVEDNVRALEYGPLAADAMAEIDRILAA